MTKLFRAYTRKSVMDETDESVSPARQRAAIERRIYATYPGSRIEWYEDLDISGRFESNRPGWQSLLADLENKGGDGVAVESYDRSHRNVKEFLNFYDTVLAPAGRTLISATQNLDLSTTDGRLMATVIMSFAEAEAGRASDRMRSTLAHIRTSGRHHGGIPFGCDRDPITKHLIPSARAYLYSPATGEALPDSGDPPPGFERRYFHDALRVLFELYATGQHSLTDVAILLNAAGWRFWQKDRSTPLEFGGTTTRSIIRHWPTYAGWLPAEMGQRVGNRKAPLFIEGSYPPILPIELCEAAGAALKSRIAQGGPKGKSRVYLIGGMAFCGVCGCKLSGQSQPNGNRYYRHTNIKKPCPEKMGQAEVIHGQIIALVGELIDGRLEGVMAELRQLEADINAREAGSAGEIERKRAEMERLISLHLKDLITEEEFTRHRADLQAEIDRLQPADVEGIGRLKETIGQLGALLEDFREEEPALQKEVIREVFQRVEIQGQRISHVLPQEWCAEAVKMALGAGVVTGLDRGPGRRLHTVGV